MGTIGLHAALKRGAPLVEITIRFKEGLDYKSATQFINSLSDELDLYANAFYGQANLRCGSATKEILEKLFGWHLVRVPLERYDEATKTWTTWTDFYRWHEQIPVQYFPPGAAELIDSIGMSQPGADDDGQWYE